MSQAPQFWKWSAGYTSPAPWPRFAALIIKLAEHEFLVGGSGVILTFSLDGRDLPTGLLTVNEGHYDSDGRWQAARRLNGDETHQGRYVRLPPESFGLQRVTLYQYR